MADGKEDDVLADEHTGEDEGAWLDIAIPTIVHHQLAKFGERVGLTADGYAKLLLFQALHPLLAAEPGMADQPIKAPSDIHVSRQKWQDQLDSWANRQNLMPAPRMKTPYARLYCCGDFDWGDTPSPLHRWALVDFAGGFSLYVDRPDLTLLQPLNDQDVSHEMWALQLAKYSDAQDLAPAPVVSNDNVRVYDGRDFDWIEGGQPAHRWATIDKNGALSVAKQAPQGASVSRD